MRSYIFISIILVTLLVCNPLRAENGFFTKDISANEVTGEFKKGSHVKLYIPNLPYLAISHAVNGALLRPANNEKGWQYDLAKSHQKINDQLWEFDLRKGVLFQDGTPFNADSILENVAFFKKAPFTFSKFSKILSHVEKLDEYKVRFHLTEPYGAFPYDIIWLQFYTEDYLTKFGWNGKPTCPNLAEPGLYGLGPYILKNGYLEGDRRSPVVELVANPNYWGADKAKVEKITLYLDLTYSDAFRKVSEQEGQIDIMPVNFADQSETVISKYSKLYISPSKNNYAVHLNMMNGHPALMDNDIRYVINHAIDKEYLLNLSMMGEGVLSPTMVSPYFYKVDEAISSLSDFFKENETRGSTKENLRKIIKEYQSKHGKDPKKPLSLKFLAQESYAFLIKDIQFFLKGVGIDLEVTFVASEKDVFDQLLNTWNNKNTKPWDLLIWGNTDWYKHPWAAFFVYKPAYSWSTIPKDNELEKLVEQINKTSPDSEGYISAVANLIEYVYSNNLMMFLPTPNNIFAVNKEVVFNPGKSAFYYLREIEVTDYHWSVRGNRNLPPERQQPVEIHKVRIK